MRIIDPHIHMYSRTTDDYEKMARSGIEVVIEPSFWLGSRRSSVGTFEDYWEHMITFERQRAQMFGIAHFTCISVNPKEARERPLALDALRVVEKYLDREGVVAVGEIGFDLITKEEEEVFVRQLHMAMARNMLMLIHTPHTNKLEGTKRIVEIVVGEKAPQEKIIIDHNTEETIGLVRRLDCWAGLTVYPSKLSPQRAVNIIKGHGTDRILINSSADWGISDPLSVPLTALEMRRAGFRADEIEKVVFRNPLAFYMQSPVFTWRP